MKQNLFVASFAGEKDLLQAISAVRKRGWPIVEAFTPYPVHGLDRALGLRRSRLSGACFFCGLLGLGLALSFQFWSSGRDWPLNVGGQPWNSLPAFVPVAFEAMVLFAGLGLVLAWLLRCRLYPGKKAFLSLPRTTDDRFVLLLEQPGPAVALAELQDLLEKHGAVHFAPAAGDALAERER